MRSLIPICLALMCLGVPRAASGQADGASEDYAWLEGFTLVELETDDIGSLHAAHALIRSRGGNIALISPPSLLLGWIPEDMAPSLIGEAGIHAIHHDVVSAHKVRARDPRSDRMVRYFNAVASGDYQRRAALRKAAAASRVQPEGDALERDAIDELAYLRNLQDQGFDLNALRDRGILAGKGATDPARVQGQTDRMTGTSTVTLMFVESDGSGADQDLYSWPDADVQDYVNGVNTGMAWWSSQASLYNDCWAAFFVRWFDPLTDTRLHQWREMLLHSSSDVPGMVVDVMSNFGYNGGSHFSRVDAFNSAQCATYGTDWAYTAFVAYNPPPTVAQLTDGRSAFAYLLGPYTFLLFRSYSWLPHEVFAHESGHIYGACDEYASGCSCGSSCLGEVNGNCEDCGGGGQQCMMRNNSFAVCTYTDEQLGWHDLNPCAPPVLTPPTIISSSPPTAYVGTSVQLTVTGSNFLYGAFTDLGSGVVIDKTTQVSGNTVLVDISLEEDATPGMRDLVISNRDLQSSTLLDGFEVLGTTRHYYAASGGNMHPYVTAATAATSLSDAIDAALEGDSVLVESGTLPINSLTIDKGVILYGGWINNFTQRDVVDNKTVLNLQGNVRVLAPGGGTGGLDGFELTNGSGAFRQGPVAGDYGGAVLILGPSGHVGNCEIYSNQTNAGGFGGGGAIYAENATINLVDNDIHDNTATRGGGIYVLNSSGTVARNTLTSNVVSVSGGESPIGAGIALEGCNNLTLQDNVVDGNTGADRGGGVKIINSSAITVSGGSISNHAVATRGGGADVDSSQVDFAGVSFLSNSSSSWAGGVAIESSSDVEFAKCQFISNFAFVHGGVYATDSDVSMRHNLFKANFASLTGGAFTLANVGTGEVTGNTLDLNISGLGTGCMRLDSAPIEVTNNIVSNSNGGGIECLNTLPTLVDWNLVTNSSASDYTGCTSGPNAVTGNPAYVDTTAIDYHLGLHSAAIDAGRTDPGYEDPDGSRGDLGIYGSHSFAMDQPVFPTGLSAALNAGNVVLSWNPNPEPDLADYAVYAHSESGFKPNAANFVTLVAAADSMLDLGPLGGTAFYTIAALDIDGYSSGFAVEAQSPDATDAPPGPLAHTFRLHANVPNPFNPITRIGFELDRTGSVRLEVYDLAGRHVRTLARGERGAGPHVVLWDGRTQRGERVSSGVYVYRLRFGERERTRKMVVLK